MYDSSCGRFFSCHAKSLSVTSLFPSIQTSPGGVSAVNSWYIETFLIRPIHLECWLRPWANLPFVKSGFLCLSSKSLVPSNASICLVRVFILCTWCFTESVITCSTPQKAVGVTEASLARFSRAAKPDNGCIHGREGGWHVRQVAEKGITCLRHVDFDEPLHDNGFSKITNGPQYARKERSLYYRPTPCSPPDSPNTCGTARSWRCS